MKSPSPARARAFWVGIVLALFVSQGVLWVAAISLTANEEPPPRVQSKAP